MTTLSTNTLSLRLHRSILTGSFITNVLSISYLIRHLNKSKDQYQILCLIAILPIFISSVFAIFAGILSNNSLIPSINDHYDIIGKYCSYIMNLNVVLTNLVQYSSWIFYLSRIKYFFTGTPFKMCNVIYYLHILFYSVLIIMSCLATIYHSKAEIFMASDSKKYKICTSNTYTISFDLQWVLFISKGVIQIYNISLLYIKTKYWTRYERNGYREEDSGIIINTKIIKRCILIDIVYCIMNTICIVLATIYDIKYLDGLLIVSLTISILFSFDSKLLANDAMSNSIQESPEIGKLKLTIKREQYLSEVMNRFYTTPQRLR